MSTTSIRRTVGAVVAVLAVGVAGLTVVATPASGHEPWARATLRDAAGRRVGVVTFSHEAGRTRIVAKVGRGTALTPSTFHGLHIHANDNPANGTGCVADPGAAPSAWFVAADGHWRRDPAEVHGGHAGDLPSPYLNADGSTEVRMTVDKLVPAEVVGRAVVLHALPDNFGNVPVGPEADQYVAGATAVARTQATGNAGDRVACGVILG